MFCFNTSSDCFSHLILSYMLIIKLQKQIIANFKYQQFRHVKQHYCKSLLHCSIHSFINLLFFLSVLNHCVTENLKDDKRRITSTILKFVWATLRIWSNNSKFSFS